MAHVTAAGMNDAANKRTQGGTKAAAARNHPNVGTGAPLAVSPVELEGSVARVESCLAALQASLREQDPAALEQASQLLRQALAASVDTFRRAAKGQAVPSAMRQRLATASATIAAQREALARATVSLDQAIDVLLPDAAASYAASGRAARNASSGWIRA
jgi:hypothetical protein